MKVSSIVSSSHLRVFLIFTCLVVGSDESDDGSRPDDRKLSPFLRGMAEQLRIGLPKNNANVGSRLKQIEAKTKRKSSQHNNFFKKNDWTLLCFHFRCPKSIIFQQRPDVLGNEWALHTASRPMGAAADYRFRMASWGGVQKQVHYRRSSPKINRVFSF